MDLMVKGHLDAYVTCLHNLGLHPFMTTAALQSAVALANFMDMQFADLEQDPAQALLDFLGSHIPYLKSIADAHGAVDSRETASKAGAPETPALFGQAWTTLDAAAYYHSISLVTQRLVSSGITPEVIRGKRCFDGGCGIGRLSMALARMGAAEVVAVDLSDQCLEYFRQIIQKEGLGNITLRKGDVTDLGDWRDEAFDFVATNGVLHHTPEPHKGLLEHLRITKDGGMLWIYLYGAGGMYWPVFDAIRPVIGAMDVNAIHSRLLAMALRPGFVYTFLDNVLAPRTYHTIPEVVELLGRNYAIRWREADGPSIFDSPSRTAASKAASLLLGPGGEVRIVVSRVGKRG